MLPFPFQTMWDLTILPPWGPASSLAHRSGSGSDTICDSPDHPHVDIVRFRAGESSYNPALTGLKRVYKIKVSTLKHPSVGAFLTHSGWNSTLEGICGGVPMICWPFFAEQQVNCRYACTTWGIGLEINSVVKREEVCRLVKEMMEEETGKIMRKKAKEWKRKADEAVGEGGSACKDFNHLVMELQRLSFNGR